MYIQVSSVITLVIAGLALLISVISFIWNRRTTRSNILNNLVFTANSINEHFVKYGIRSPYSELLQVPKRSLKIYELKTSLLFDQINLLYAAYLNRRLIGKHQFTSYINWMREIVKPWIHSDKSLVKTAEIAMRKEDLWKKDFVVCLRDLLK
jgi:hypothetical protein